jgi:hypothetical protein
VTRPLLIGGGLPGPGQDIFSDDAKTYARALGMTDLYNVERDEGEKVGGVKKEDWATIAEHVPGRVDNVSRRLPKGIVADSLNEETTHIIHLNVDPVTDLTAADRIVDPAHDLTWAVLARIHRTDEPTMMLEAKII